MKKLIALLVAMMMAFTCVSALAETAEEQPGLPFDLAIPNLTLTYSLELDEEQAAALLATAQLPEESAGMAKMLLPLLNGLGEQLIFADNGVQFDLSMKGQEILSLVAEATETGFALSTNLLPSYMLTIQTATIQKLVEEFMKQAEEASGKLDMELIEKAAEKIAGYAMETFGAFQSLVIFGEPVKGEYADLIEGVTFNTEKTLIVDVAGMMEAVKQFATKALSDEDIKAAIDSIVAMIPGASFDPAQILGSLDVPAEYIPDVAGLVYTITDDEGNQTAVDTFVIVNAVGKESDEGDTTTYVYVAENALDISVEIPAQNVSFEIYGELVENGLVATIAVSAEGMDAVLELTAAATDTGVNVGGALYLNDAETPLVNCSIGFAMAGERTKKATDGEKAEFALDGLLDEQNAPNLFAALVMDAVTNGLGNVMNNIKTVMPMQGAILEQMVNQLVSQFFGGAEEAPVEEEAPAA